MLLFEAQFSMMNTEFYGSPALQVNPIADRMHHASKEFLSETWLS